MKGRITAAMNMIHIDLFWYLIQGNRDSFCIYDLDELTVCELILIIHTYNMLGINNIIGQRRT